MGANYIGAIESHGENDFLMPVRISRKEAKESFYWLRLLFEMNGQQDVSELQKLMNEANELTKIFSSNIEKSK